MAGSASTAGSSTATTAAAAQGCGAPAGGPLDESLIETAPIDMIDGIDDDVVTAAPQASRRPVMTGAVLQLLRSAVALQAEDLLRTIGALALARRDVREWAGLVERDVRDLAFLASAAVAAGAPLPAGLDGGSGDPSDPGSAIEGLLASHEALMRVLRQLAQRCPDPQVGHTTRAVLERREEEATVLRGLGAGRGLPKEVRLVHGALPKYQA